MRVDLPAQPLAASLRELAAQAGVQLLFAPELVGRRLADPVRGEMDVEHALQQLLAGSGLEFRRDGERSFVVLRRGQAMQVLPETVVAATRSPHRPDEVPASVSVISAAELSRQQLRQVEDALKNVEGVDFNTSGATAFASTPMLRGIGGSFAGSTSAVLLDGLATDSPISAVAGRGGFGFLAAQDIERIEVVRGPASALYGPNVVGGVVNVVPKRWQGKAGGEVEAGLGSHAAQSLGAAVGVAEAAYDFRLSAYDFQTDGYVAKPRPDPWGAKDAGPRGWQDRKLALNGAVRPSDDQEIAFAVQHFRTEQDYVGGDVFRNSEKRDGDAYTLSYLKEFAAGKRFKLSFRHLDLSQSWIDDPAGMGEGNRQSRSDLLEAQVDLHPAKGNTLIFGASWQAAEFQTVSVTDGSRDNSKATTTGVFVQDEQRFANWLAIVGGRFDRFDQGASHTDGVAVHRGSVEDVFNPRLGLRYFLSPATSFYASAGSAYVPANADFKYNTNPARWKDNPDLKPERSVTYEIGAEHKVALGKLRAALYHTDYEDMISSISVGATPWPKQFVNIGRVAVDGLELGFSGEVAGGWQPYANYTYTDSQIKENPSDPATAGKQVQRIAPHKLNFGVVYAPGEEWNASLAGRYVSERFFRDSNTADHRAAPYFVGDAKINLRLPGDALGGKWQAYLAVNNLLDRKYTVWEYEYADGRSFWAGVNARF